MIKVTKGDVQPQPTFSQSLTISSPEGERKMEQSGIWENDGECVLWWKQTLTITLIFTVTNV